MRVPLKLGIRLEVRRPSLINESVPSVEPPDRGEGPGMAQTDRFAIGERKG
jgi:hypothetical protein